MLAGPLVTTAIVATLIGLLQTAVQLAWEAARTSNLGQIGLGILGYASVTKNVLPDGAFDKSTQPGGMRGSGFVLVLPWVEQEQPDDAIDVDPMSIAIDGMRIPGSSKFIRSVAIPTFVCPTDDRVLVDAASSGPTAHDDNANRTCQEALPLNA